MEILHSGQTGVERGAWGAARLLNCSIRGICTVNVRDEFGLLPVDVRRELQPSRDRGPRSALRETAVLASAIVVIVPQREDVVRSPGIAQLLRGARSTRTPHWITDGRGTAAELVAWLASLDADPLTCLVTGPRETRWPDGERVARALVIDLLSRMVPAHEIEVSDRPRGYTVDRA